MSKSFLNQPNQSRGLRNNNPGNLIKTTIKWQGKITPSSDNAFEQFENVYFGLRAMFKDLINDINKGKNTVTKLISEYAPPHENDTDAYINDVCKTIGVTPNQKLTKINANFLVKLGRAIIKVENGAKHTQITDFDLLKSIAMLGNVSTATLEVEISDATKAVKNNVLTLIEKNKKIILGLLVFFYSVVTLLI
jgi:hypothetical protein